MIIVKLGPLNDAMREELRLRFSLPYKDVYREAHSGFDHQDISGKPYAFLAHIITRDKPDYLEVLLKNTKQVIVFYQYMNVYARTLRDLCNKLKITNNLTWSYHQGSCITGITQFRRDLLKFTVEPSAPSSRTVFSIHTSTPHEVELEPDHEQPVDESHHAIFCTIGEVQSQLLALKQEFVKFSHSTNEAICEINARNDKVCAVLRR